MRHHLRQPPAQPKDYHWLKMVGALALAWLLLWFAIVFVIATKAEAHQSPTGQNYPSYCCNGNTDTGDCQAIAPETVHPIDGGYGIQLKPGDHRRVTKPQSYAVPQAEVRQSVDGQYHICLYPKEDNARCFFAPPSGS